MNPFFRVHIKVVEIFKFLLKGEDLKLNYLTVISTFALLAIIAVQTSNAIVKLSILFISVIVIILGKRRYLDELMHSYLDMVMLVLMISTPAIIMLLIQRSGKDVFQDFAKTLLNVLSASTPMLTCVFIVGINGMYKVLSFFSKTFSKIFLYTFLLLPRITFFASSVCFAKLSRLAKHSRTEYLKIMTSTIADSVLYSVAISKPLILSITSRTIVEDHQQLKFNHLDAALIITIATLIAVMRYLAWI